MEIESQEGVVVHVGYLSKGKTDYIHDMAFEKWIYYKDFNALLPDFQLKEANQLFKIGFKKKAFRRFGLCFIVIKINRYFYF